MENTKAQELLEAADEELDLYTRTIAKAHDRHHPEVFGARGFTRRSSAR